MQWPHEYRAGGLRLNEEGITLLELLPVILACVVWGSRCRHQSVLVLCDNAGALAYINSGYSREPHLMHMLSCLFSIRVAFGISLWAVHIPGKLNHLADAVSRDNLPYFFLRFRDRSVDGSQYLLPFWICWWALGHIGRRHAGPSSSGALCSGFSTVHTSVLSVWVCLVSSVLRFVWFYSLPCGGTCVGSFCDFIIP